MIGRWCICHKTQGIRSLALEEKAPALQSPTPTARPLGAFHGPFQLATAPITHHASFGKLKAIPEKISASVNNQESRVSTPHPVLCRK